MQKQEFIKEYIEARGGLDVLSEKERNTLVGMAMNTIKNTGVELPVDTVDLGRAIRDLKKYSNGSTISIYVISWLLRNYSGLPKKPMPKSRQSLGMGIG